jgi:hypothetical protein
MPVLARDEQRVLADHEIPTDAGVPGEIGAAVALDAEGIDSRDVFALDSYSSST